MPPATDIYRILPGQEPIISGLTALQEAVAIGSELDLRKRCNKILAYYNDQDTDFYGKVYPAREKYKKHLKFFGAGSIYPYRLICAANRVGKTEGIGAYEMTLHLTGRYPPWWEGKRFDHPVHAIIGGDTSKTVRDAPQLVLMGPEDDLGTGMIPADCIIRKTLKSGVTGAFDKIYIQHQTNGVIDGISDASFKSYEEGRKAFQATNIHVSWLDEEPPEDVAEEATVRTMDTGGIVLYTFTPIQGLTRVVKKFMPGGKVPSRQHPYRWVIQAEWDDAPHLTEEMKAKMLEEVEPHLRDARTRGIPTLGSGAIYPVAEKDITVDPFEIPPWWPKCFGFDVGWNWTAAVWMAWNRETDTVYIYDEYKRGEAEPDVHAAAIKARGEWIPGAIDPSANNRNSKDGDNLLYQYRENGLTLHRADNAVEAGIYKVWRRLTLGKLKVFKHCTEWLSEYRTYHRDEKGRIVKEDDHLMDGTRYGIMTGMSVAEAEPFEIDPETIYRQEIHAGQRSAITGY